MYTLKYDSTGRIDWWLPGAGGEGNGEVLVKGCKLPLIR